MAIDQTGYSTVAFHGARGGKYPLTWGQKDIYRAFRRYSPRTAFFNVRNSLPVPSGVGLSEVCDSIRWAIEEYEALRTVYHAYDQGDVCQSIKRDGTFRLHLFEAADQTYRHGSALGCFGSEFDPFGELPMRGALVSEYGRPAWLLLEFSHLALDLEGGRILRRALARKLGGQTDKTVESYYQPGDRANDERTPENVSRSTHAIEYLSTVLDPQEVPVFTTETPGLVSRHNRPRIKMTSPALGAAVATLSKLQRISTAVIYLACAALLAGGLSGRRRLVLCTAASNRWLPGSGSYVGTLNQYAPFAADLTAADFPALLKRIQAASLRAFSHALYDIDAVTAAGLIGLLDHVDCTVNNSQIPGNSVLPRATGLAVKDLRTQTSLQETTPMVEPPEQVRRSLQLSVAGTGTCPELSLSADPSVLSVDGVSRALLAIESFVAQEAAGPGKPGNLADALEGIRTWRA